jgi:hypothetical protein
LEVLAALSEILFPSCWGDMLCLLRLGSGLFAWRWGGLIMDEWTGRDGSVLFKKRKASEVFIDSRLIFGAS